MRFCTFKILVHVVRLWALDLGEGFYSRIIAFLCYSGVSGMSWRRLVKHNLCIFSWVSPSWGCPWKDLKAVFMHIYMSLAFLGMSLERLEASFYAYLRESRSLGDVPGKAWRQFLCIFTWVSPSWGCPWRASKAIRMHIYVSLALLEMSLESLESNMYAYLRESRPRGDVPGKNYFRP